MDVLFEDDRWGDLEPLAVRACAAALEGIGLEPSVFEISLLGCDDTRIAKLNEDFRQKGQPTNVLSWPSVDRAAMADGEMPIPPQLPMDAELGDIAIAFETCQREAEERGIPFEAHATHLLVSHATTMPIGHAAIHAHDLLRSELQGSMQ